ncbi:MAG: 4Fe-4S binding protein [Candidatus Cloacimonadaceae bacterium]|nr:4Fe-4S binding protein [Candidatus Cloacimonadaceae bacterium]MDP3114264.1 4Fe-4S binding protein [Candidatus Cloacimonadaceae bacterium]
MKMERSQKIRLAIQLLFLLLSLAFLALTIAGTRLSIHQGCPYAIVCFGLSGTTFLQLANTIAWLSIFAGFLILVYGMFRGRKFCAYVCPLGTAQEGVFALRSKKYRTKKRVPWLYERKYAFVKYLILLLTSVMVIRGVGYLFIQLCPFYALSRLPIIGQRGLLLLVLILFAGFFTERFWCRFLCPYAALMNVFQWIGARIGLKRRKVKRNLERCNDCGVCMLYCPMNINIAEYEYVRDPNCIHCQICAEKCPKPGTYSEEFE